MQKIKDNAGRTWEIAIDIPAVRRVRDHLEGLDLLSILDKDSRLFERLANEEELIYDVLYCVCKPQADEQDISDEDFGRGFVGPQLLAASDALIEELINFFPPPKSEILQKLWAKTKQKQDRLWQYASKQTDRPEVDEILDREVLKAEQKMDQGITAMLKQSREEASPTPTNAGA